MYFITNGDEAENAVFNPVDVDIGVICTLNRWEQVLLLSRMFTMDHFHRLCFHRSLNGFQLMSTFNSWIAGMPNLTRLEVTDAPNIGVAMIAQFFRAVSRSHVRYLNVSGLALGHDGAQHLCKMVDGSNGRIHTIRAERNNMQNCIEQLLQLPLKCIMIGDNNVHRNWWPKAIAGIAPKVRRLGLDRSGLGQLGFTAIGRYLMLAQLAELDLGGNVVKIGGMKALCAGMIGHACLQTLYLNGCQMRNSCLKIMATMLTMNQSLQQLYMHNNPGIDELGQVYLIKGLQTNFTLRYIEIDVLFSKTCDQILAKLEPSRITIDAAEPVTAHLTRLICKNQDLDLAHQMWHPRLHRFYPRTMQDRTVLLICLLSKHLPYDLILHILSFWHGIQFI